MGYIYTLYTNALTNTLNMNEEQEQIENERKVTEFQTKRENKGVGGVGVHTNEVNISKNYCVNVNRFMTFTLTQKHTGIYTHTNTQNIDGVFSYIQQLQVFF